MKQYILGIGLTNCIYREPVDSHSTLIVIEKSSIRVICSSRGDSPSDIINGEIIRVTDGIADVAITIPILVSGTHLQG